MTRRSSSPAGPMAARRIVDGGRPLDLARLPVVGEGGEAVVYALGRSRVAKVFKGPDHPDYAGSPEARAGAVHRLAEHQTKLAAFPAGVPDRLVAPASILHDESGRVAGYTMPFIDGAELLHRYGQRSFREGRVADPTVVALFLDLHATLTAVHGAGIVVGDLNDLNVLVRDDGAWLVDADSMQYGGFSTRVYTERFLDPRLADPSAVAPVLARPYDEDADWYAFTCLLMQSLLYVGPYGGVHRPEGAVARMPHAARPLHRVSVFHEHVRYPKPARPWTILPDPLIEHLREVFERDRRGAFPDRLLHGLHWSTCSGCGTAHARTTCPACRIAVPLEELPVQRVRGRVAATRLVETPGPVLAVRFSGDRLLWLAAGPRGPVREDGTVLSTELAAGDLRIGLRPGQTFLAQPGRVRAFHGADMEEEWATAPWAGARAFAINDRSRYWLADGALWRDERTGPERVGDIARGPSALWVGPAFGFGFYRVGELTVAFVFDARAGGINDGVRLPRLAGQLVRTEAVFGDGLCWFEAETRERGRAVRSLAVVGRAGAVAATAAGELTDEPWWPGLAGACAVGPHLFLPTDDGIVRLTVEDGRVRRTAEFPDTEPFVHSGCTLFTGPDGLHAADETGIVRLAIR